MYGVPGAFCAIFAAFGGRGCAEIGVKGLKPVGETVCGTVGIDLAF